MSQQQVIVSLTSFPPAISYAAQAVQSILNGSVLPDKVVLYLTFAEFGEKGIPQDLQELAKKNPRFEIRDYPINIRSYRKLVPALTDFPEIVIYAASPSGFFPTALTKFAGGMRKKKLVFFPHVGVRKVFAAAVKVQYLFSQEFRGGALTYADTVIFDPGIFKGLFPAVKPL